MKARSVLILLALAAFAVFVCLFMARKSASELKASAGGKPFEAVAVNDSERIVVSDASGACELKKLDGVWVVPAKSDYPANFTRLGSLLRDIVELKPSQAIPGGEACLERFELADPLKAAAKAGLEIQVFGKGSAKPIIAIRRGKSYKTFNVEDEMSMAMGGSRDSSRFAYLPASNAVVVIGNPLRQASASAADWLDKDFIKISALKSVSLSDGAKTLWTIRRESPSSEWSIDGEIPPGLEFDKQAASSINDALAWLSFRDVAGKASGKPEYGLDHPKTVVAESFDGISCKFAIGDSKGGKTFATASVEFKPVPRVAPKDEKPEDAKKAEEESAKKLSESKAKAETMSKLVSGWIYVFDNDSFERALSPREKLVKAKAAKDDAEALNPAAFQAQPPEKKPLN